MEKNKVVPDVETYALRFILALHLNDLDEATRSLRRLQLTNYEGFQPVPVSNLEKFFEQSLKRDNFDGLAFLIAYLETHNIDIGSWKVDRFRSAVNFYLNHAFNLNKILTFTRFYVHRAKKALAKEKVEVY